MKILFIAQRLPYPPNKGEKIRSYHQIEYLVGLGHDVTVITPAESGEDTFAAKAFSDKLKIEVELIGIGSRRLKLVKGFCLGESLSVANFYSHLMLDEIELKLSEQNYDVIVCTASSMAEYVFNSRFIATHENIKLFMDFMDLDSDKWQQYAQTSRFPMRWVYQREAKILAKYEAKIQAYFDACFFIADTEVDLFKQRQPKAKNIFTLGNGLNTQDFYPPTEPVINPAPTFIFTGVMDYKPNVDAVVWFVESCWSDILTLYPQAEFIIAGMNPNSAVMNLEKRTGITITGFVDEILPYYHKADYFVAPFRIARGVQNKVLQAFACGLPVISTPMGAEGIDCKHGQDILIAHTVDDFMTNIQLLENNNLLKQQIKQNALNLIQDKFSWQSKLAMLQDMIETN